MCGIVGVIDKNFCDKNIIEKMVSEIHHRGPDDQGIWIDDRWGVALGHTRLSIQDLSKNGSQPMVSKSGRFVTVFNGEIYNHLDLRKKLSSNNLSLGWVGTSDTETLLAGFEKWGISKTLEKCVGMFSLAVWDKNKKSLSISRDRFGEKPLYYGFHGQTFLFGSELKAIRKHPSFSSEVDRNALASFFNYGYVPNPQSIYKGIKKLPPGNIAEINIGSKKNIKIIKYFDYKKIVIDGNENPFVGSDIEAIKSVGYHLKNAVQSQEISDVPLGAFLSGGIDSSLIVSMLQKYSSKPVNTFTIGYDESNFNEAKYAKNIATYLGTKHTEKIVSPTEAIKVVDHLSFIYDEPFADSSQIPTYLVSKLAREHVSVSLSGDGADEIFGGYNRYMWTDNISSIPRFIRKPLSNCLTFLTPHQWDLLFKYLWRFLPQKLQLKMPGDRAHKLALIIKYSDPKDIYLSLTSIWRKEDDLLINNEEQLQYGPIWDGVNNIGSNRLKMMMIDALTYLSDDILCKVDRASMSVSLETRAPFLDKDLIDFASTLPMKFKIRGGESKWILRQLLYNFVPRELVDRPKMGFGVPIDSWLRGPLKPWAESLLSESKIRSGGYINYNVVKQKFDEHLSGKRNWQYMLWNVLMFQSWLERNEK
jgi:asparagine synthase (glutamine-hydrolysing)